MGIVQYKVICPKHPEDTPSCAVYEDGSGFCFGCQTYFPKIGDKVEKPKVQAEDLPATLDYVRQLPVQTHRGLKFPVDKLGYYIIWPNTEFYKLRFWDDSGPRYKSPKGIKQPWMIFKGDSTTCMVIEGEINALSLREAYPRHATFCPGGVSQFTDNNSEQYLSYLCLFKDVVIIVDNDIPGVNAAIKLKQKLNSCDKLVRIVALDTDCNDLLITKGREGIRDAIKIRETI